MEGESGLSPEQYSLGGGCLNPLLNMYDGNPGPSNNWSDPMLYQPQNQQQNPYQDNGASPQHGQIYTMTGDFDVETYNVQTQPDGDLLPLSDIDLAELLSALNTPQDNTQAGPSPPLNSSQEIIQAGPSPPLNTEENVQADPSPPLNSSHVRSSATQTEEPAGNESGAELHNREQTTSESVSDQASSPASTPPRRKKNDIQEGASEVSPKRQPILQDADGQVSRPPKRKLSAEPAEENSKHENNDIPPPKRQKLSPVKKSNDKGGRNTSSGWFRIVSVWFTCVISKVGGYLKFWNYWSGTASEVSVNETPDAKNSVEQVDNQEKNDEMQTSSEEDGSSTDIDMEDGDNTEHDGQMEISERPTPSQDELLKILKGIKKEKQNDLGWGALKLLGMLFTAHELATHCYRKPTKSCGKPYLSDTHKDKVDLLEECLRIHYGEEKFKESRTNMIQRCNQKCRDAVRRL